MSDKFNADYFLRGKELGISGYTDYKWIPELTIPMVQHIVDHCGITKGSKILDFGCARGYVVKALRGLGYDAYGLDVSEWAIENADADIKQFVKLYNDISRPLVAYEFDWIIAKDVLEHIPYVQYPITKLMNAATVGLFAVVPLAPFDGSEYIIPEYEADITHIQRYTLGTWLEMFLRPGWSIEASYRVPGVKDNYAKPGWERGNGFITAKRIK